jgi:hypothetical protein
MSDDPRKLKAILLEEATTEQQKEFAEMLARQCAEAELRAKGHHRCWFFVLSPLEYERMAKYRQPPDYDKCPKCGKGRIVVEIYNGNLGQGLTLKCYFNKDGCDFSEYISDDE